MIAFKVCIFFIMNDEKKYWSCFNIAALKKREQDMIEALSAPNKTKNLLWFSPEEIEMLSRVYRDENRLTAFNTKHPNKETNWWPGLYEHSSESLYQTLMDMGDNFTKNKFFVLYKQIEQCDAVNSIMQEEIQYCKHLPCYHVQHLTRGEMAGRLVRALRHIHPQNYEKIVKKFLSSPKDHNGCCEVLKQCLVSETELHKAKLTNIEDGRHFTQMLASKEILSAITKGLLLVKDDIVLLCWGGDWSNHFWFWFAWYGPGYQFLRCPESTQMTTQQIKDHFKRPSNRYSEDHCDFIANEIKKNWKSRLQHDKNNLLNKAMYATHGSSILAEVCNEMLIKQLFWIHTAHQNHYQYWKFTTWNCD